MIQVYTPDSVLTDFRQPMMIPDDGLFAKCFIATRATVGVVCKIILPIIWNTNPILHFRWRMVRSFVYNTHIRRYTMSYTYHIITLSHDDIATIIICTRVSFAHAFPVQSCLWYQSTAHALDEWNTRRYNKLIIYRFLFSSSLVPNIYRICVDKILYNVIYYIHSYSSLYYILFALIRSCLFWTIKTCLQFPFILGFRD